MGFLINVQVQGASSTSNNLCLKCFLQAVVSNAVHIFDGFAYIINHHIIMGFLINVQVQGASSTSVGPFPGNWLAARIADLTPDLQVLLS